MSDDRAIDPDSTAAPSRARGRSDERTPNTALNALVGGVVTVATALFVPFSPVLGGGVAGYLEGGGTDEGLKVGVLAGAIASVPLFLAVLVALFFVPVVGPPRGAVGILVVVLFVFLVAGAYTVGLSALGGVLGTYLQREL